jgi:hypothetical protein
MANLYSGLNTRRDGRAAGSTGSVPSPAAEGDAGPDRRSDDVDTNTESPIPALATNPSHSHQVSHTILTKRVTPVPPAGCGSDVEGRRGSISFARSGLRRLDRCSSGTSRLLPPPAPTFRRRGTHLSRPSWRKRPGIRCSSSYRRTGRCLTAAIADWRGLRGSNRFTAKIRGCNMPGRTSDGHRPFLMCWPPSPGARVEAGRPHSRPPSRRAAAGWAIGTGGAQPTDCAASIVTAGAPLITTVRGAPGTEAR